MHMIRAIRSLVLATAVCLAVTATASAGNVLRETIHDEGTFVLEGFCDEAGLTVELAFSMDIRLQVGPHGRDRVDYFLQHGTRTEVITNAANGRFVTSTAKVIEKDLRITDNGDGTLTILVLATGNAVLYGADGTALARNPGQTRFELVIDQAGTPDDPFDDELVSQTVVKESTGRSDDFCTAAVTALS